MAGGSQPRVIGGSGSGPRLQNLDDFEKEQDELQKQLDQEKINAQLRKLQSGSPAIRRAKNTPDVASILLEVQALEEMGETNWVGRLLEYHQANAIFPGTEYTEFQISHERFSYSVTIKENPEPISSNVSFARKKDAKQFISKLAIDWLISQNLMPSNGAVKFPKAPVAPQTPNAKIPRTPISPPSASASALPSTTSPQERSISPTSYPALIPDLCHSLGLNIPTYKIVPMVEGVPIYHVYADFGFDPHVLGRVGEFRDIFGKKKAKEVCAKEVWNFLKDIERQRLEKVEDAGREMPQDQAMNGEVRIVAGI
ncbi:hypothetical protein NHQ30_005643 [Ciborinia camelliae]|nr:hypothetical protein NHQ30_005643 [Ciborinia camelliae]